MSEEQRSAILKAALLLALLEGWTEPISVRARLGVDVGEALGWLWRSAYIEQGEGLIRWRVERTFEELWVQLVPERGCPVRLCSETRSTGVASNASPMG